MHLYNVAVKADPGKARRIKTKMLVSYSTEPRLIISTMEYFGNSSGNGKKSGDDQV